MKNAFTYTQPRLASLSWYMWLFVVSFASLGNKCGCQVNAPIDDTFTDNTPSTLSLEFRKLSYDRDNSRLVAIIKNIGKATAKGLSLRSTNISKDEASRIAVLFNNTVTTTTIPILDLASGSSTQEIYAAIDFQTAKEALVQMEVISGKQEIKTDTIQVNRFPIDLLPIGGTIVIAKLGEMEKLKWKLVTDGHVDFSTISLKIDKVKGADIDVSVDGTPIVLTKSIDEVTITGADLEKLAKQKEILVKVKNNKADLKLVYYTLLDNDKEIAKVINFLIPDIKAALLPATIAGNIDFVKQAIINGANVNTRNTNKVPVLHIAILGGHHEIVEILLNNGADINAIDNDGNTALHLAASKGDQAIARLLLHHRANKNITNNKGETAVDFAKDQEIKDLINNWKN